MPTNTVKFWAMLLAMSIGFSVIGLVITATVTFLLMVILNGFQQSQATPIFAVALLFVVVGHVTLSSLLTAWIAKKWLNAVDLKFWLLMLLNLATMIGLGGIGILMLILFRVLG